MASIGRGRGCWTRQVDCESALRRPGRSASPEKTEIDELLSRIYDLSIDATPKECSDRLITFIKSDTNHERPENLDKMWKQALNDRCFGIKFVKFYKDEYQTVNKDVSTEVMKYVYTNMQTCYEKREELRKENPLHLTNLAWMLGVIVQTAAPALVRFLGQALLNCLIVMLDTATEDETETVAIQLYLHGGGIRKRLEEDLRVYKGVNQPLDPESFSVIVNKSRHILVNRNVSARSRALLLMIVDLANQQYEPLDNELLNFYANILAPTHTPENDSKFRTGREFNQTLYFHEILTKEIETRKNENHAVQFQKAPRKKPAPQQQPQQQQQQQQQPQLQKIKRNEVTTGPVPRAIRGSGASESSKDHRNEKKSPRGQKEKLTDEQVWSAKQNTGSKVWGHDDRFDNDYE